MSRKGSIENQDHTTRTSVNYEKKSLKMSKKRNNKLITPNNRDMENEGFQTFQSQEKSGKKSVLDREKNKMPSTFDF